MAAGLAMLVLALAAVLMVILVPSRSDHSSDYVEDSSPVDNDVTDLVGLGARTP